MKDKLNIKQEKFVQNIVSGMSQRQAYKQAFQVEYDENAIDSNASTLFKQAKIQQRYKELIEELKEASIMTAKQRMIWLSDIVNDKQLDTSNEEHKPADLNTKMKAIDILNKMSGEYITKLEADVNTDMTINIELSDE